MRKKNISSFNIFVIGILFGILSKLLDIYTTNFGNIFSGISIWVLLGVLISIYSKTYKESMVRVFVFCIGMLIGYYITAEITNSVYYIKYIVGWFLFSLCTPVFSYFTWFTKEKSIFGKFISLGILIITTLFSIVLYDGFRIYDYVILGILIYFLFFKNIDRGLS